MTLLPILPTLGSMLFAIALYQRKPLWTKLLSIAGNLLWMIYAGIVGNPSGLLSSGILLFSALLGLLRERTGSPKSQS